MKHLLYIILSLGVMYAGSSCMKIDNFDEPEASVSGTVIDATTGKPMMFDQGDTHIRIWERSYSINPSYQDLAVKADGTYRNTRLFAGTYDMIPCDGAYWPCDTTYNVKIGRKGAVADFEVTPYLHVVDFQQELNGTELTLSCKLQAPVVENLPQVVEVRPFLSLNEHCGAANHINYYYTDSYRVNIRKLWNKIGDAEGNGTDTYSITLTVKPGYTYWCRMGVQVNNTYKNWNYSEVVKITVPNS